ncbi:hypothetical protein HRR80_003724 [Exophiala dermatitidis]|uniref:Ribonucleases P/MRP subunit Pop8-like domain-containing protein n=2 Tax=Exophiala dermatitidis TaxID=5970 RepID=H6BXP2_EXODN|nr:uncharacterized protein HMPREF1120_04647 [Exophiala dermatitidis NIH/UT8656]KAJ4520358.1 hypothetical protein HRR75_002223 [Exophiala dermatitidis]EHY56569.1 hypothetical protein HMPREF1120_04647 [Exophiala dermatitidis NIH/UT8656]KAJ4525500.1 hypothetical protein HRR73_002230 [Exophiala dermatitidis]KAJ4536817.1 hypothetical protein HRR76_004843 [Exophiala dermatitidis]KAJ4556273.1 hypothetical protein HRR78_001932 [Exophiala dermatitidis]
MSPSSMSSTFTIRNPPYTYFHLSLQQLPLPTQQNQAQQEKEQMENLDDVRARSYLFAAMQQYLGLTGTAIPIDILKVESVERRETSSAPHVWIRVPRDDEVAVTAALAQWVGARGVSLRIEERGCWLGGLLVNDEDEKRLWSMER